MNVVYISDTNIWIDFRNAGLLDHMFQLPFSLCCTDFVLRELQDLPQEQFAENANCSEYGRIPGGQPHKNRRRAGQVVRFACGTTWIISASLAAQLNRTGR